MRDIINFYERSFTLLAAQFREGIEGETRTNIQKLIAALVTPFYDINRMQLQLYNDRFLATAVGVQLDLIGDILGLPRGLDSVTGMLQTDSDYREALYFQVFINRSTGTPEEAIATLKFLTKATLVQYMDSFPAFYQMFTNGLPENFSVPPQDLVQAMTDLSPAGVQYVPIAWNYNYDLIFEFTGDPIADDFYVNPNPNDLDQFNPFIVSKNGVDDLQFQVDRGSTTDNPDAGCFAEDNYFVAEAGELCEVLVLNGNIPSPR